jgi:hypothetical protein
MANLPWLVQAAGAGPDRMREARTEAASRDLSELAGRIRGDGLHLIIEGAVDIAFAFRTRHLPPGTVDARDRDALGIAMADPTGLLVTADGLYIGLRAARDPRWAVLASLGRSRGRLGSSALSGWYHGLVVDGPHAGRFRDGVREELVAVEAELVYDDRTTARIEETTLGHVVRRGDETIRCRSLAEAIRSSERMPVEVTSAVHTAGELASILEDAGRMVPPSLVLNGQVWRGGGATGDVG